MMIHIFKSAKRKISRYFEKNITGYTYLFFAQGAFVAENLYWNYMMRGDFGKVPLHSFQGYYNTSAFYITYFLPIIFILGALLTFKYPEDRLNKFSLLVLHITLCSIILISGLIEFRP